MVLRSERERSELRRKDRTRLALGSGYWQGYGKCSNKGSSMPIAAPTKTGHAEQSSFKKQHATALRTF